ncbi:MAG: sugar-binding transcriptional regulator [Burkholderiales bacterium]|nr:sugar-binding transcriptional regulator [Burkholderiales bacterium]
MTDAQEPALAVRAAWLYYVHGLTQAQVAEHLALSRVKVHRLIAQAHRQNSVKVFVEGGAGECVLLEERLKSAFGLGLARVTPSDTGSAAADGPLLRGLGAAAGLLLHQYLDQHPGASVGVGHGRTLAAVAEALPRIARPRASFVSILGSLTRRSTANPFDVIYRFAERTGGAGYFVPAPFFVDSVDDAEIFRAQRVVRDVLERACRTDVLMVGIGNLSNTPAIYARERKALKALGVVAEVLGQFFDGQGREVRCDMAARSISLRLSELRGRRVIGVAGGIDKAAAIRATLASGLLSGLVTDEATAREVLRERTAARRPLAKALPATSRRVGA